MASPSPKPRSRDQFRPSLHRRRHPSESLVKCPNTSLEFNGVLSEPNQLNVTPYCQVAFKPGSKISLRSPGSSSPSPWQHLQPSQGDSFQLNYFLLPHWASLFFNILLLHFCKRWRETGRMRSPRQNGRMNNFQILPQDLLIFSPGFLMRIWSITLFGWYKNVIVVFF